MVKSRKQAQMPVKGGTRRNRNKQPKINSTSSDSSVVRYQTLSNVVGIDATGSATQLRQYVPGNSAFMANGAGPTIVSFYSTAKFLPGTSVRWEPSCSFTITGRVYVGFSDNPEFSIIWQAASAATRLNLVRGLGSVISFPVWQETNIPFPNRLRRKMFDINTTVTADTNDLDRCMQTCMYIGIDGGPTTAQNVGSFWFKDVVAVEGVHSTAT